MMGETLVNKGVITLVQLDKALDFQKTSGDKLGDAIIKLGFATQEQIDNALK
jgi:type IV pilus assembly protein PilB